jgi:hypothetical protein
MLDTILSILYAFTYLIFPKALGGMNYYSHFTEEKCEAKKIFFFFEKPNLA